MARRFDATPWLIAATLGGIAYLVVSRRKAIMERAADKAMATVFEDPQGVIDMSLVARDLGIDVTDYTGFGETDEWAFQYDAGYGAFGAFNKNSTLKEIRVARKDIKRGKKDLKKVKDVHKQIRYWTRPGLFRGGKGKGVLARTMIPFKKKIRKAEAKAWRKVKNLDRQLSSADQKLAMIQSQLRMIPSGFGGFDDEWEG